MNQRPSRRGRKPQALPIALPRSLAAWAVLLCAAPLAMAGRPLSSDDASTADAGTCQVEAWSARDTRDTNDTRSASARSVVLAPACGLAAGLPGWNRAPIAPASVRAARSPTRVVWR